MHTCPCPTTPCPFGPFSRRSSRFRAASQGQPSTMDLKTDSHYVLSGGMGALGMVTAQYLLEELWQGQWAAGCRSPSRPKSPIKSHHQDNLWILVVDPSKMESKQGILPVHWSFLMKMTSPMVGSFKVLVDPQEGAKSMSLLSRSGRPSADITELWAQLQEK